MADHSGGATRAGDRAGASSGDRIGRKLFVEKLEACLGTVSYRAVWVGVACVWVVKLLQLGVVRQAPSAVHQK